MLTKRTVFGLSLGSTTPRQILTFIMKKENILKLVPMQLAFK